MNDLSERPVYEVTTDVSPGLWDAFVDARPESNFYQYSGWQDVVRLAFRHRIHYLAALRNRQLVGILPLAEIKSRLFGHSLVSTPFCVGGGPLVSEPGAQSALLDRAQALARELGVDHVELRDCNSLGSGWQAKEGLYAGFERGIAADEQDCLKQIPRKQRAVVRKALESTLTFSIDDDLSAFYALHALTFRNHGTPVFPKRYYEELRRVFGTKCDVLTVRYEGKAVASVMSFYLRGRVTPYYTGSAPIARDLGANDLMYWQLMRHAHSRGCTSFDFGRSKTGTGPYSFKKNWGFEPRPITNWYFLVRGTSLPNLNPTNPKYAMAIRAWQRLPVPVANFIAQFVSPDLA